MTLKKPIVHIVWIVVFLIYVAVLAYLYFATFESNSELPQVILGIPLDKCIHFLMFLPFPVLGTIAFCKNSWWRTLCWSTIAANIMAFVFESQQHYINPVRFSQAEDLNANILGITTGLLIMALIGLISKKK